MSCDKIAVPVATENTYLHQAVEPPTPYNRSKKKRMRNYSMLMFINPSLVSVMPCSPTRLGVPLWGGFRPGPSWFARSRNGGPREDFGSGPQALFPVSFTTGEFDITGLLCALVLGDTALRLKRLESRSSSRRRFREMSTADGICGGWKGVEARELGFSDGLAESPAREPSVAGVMSIAESSSDIDDVRVGRVGGGGVRYRSSKEFQNSCPAEFRFA